MKQRIIQVKDLASNQDITIVLEHKSDFLDMSGSIIFDCNDGKYISLAEGTNWEYQGIIKESDLRELPEDEE